MMEGPAFVQAMVFFYVFHFEAWLSGAWALHTFVSMGVVHLGCTEGAHGKELLPILYLNPIWGI